MDLHKKLKELQEQIDALREEIAQQTHAWAPGYAVTQDEHGPVLIADDHRIEACSNTGRPGSTPKVLITSSCDQARIPFSVMRGFLDRATQH